jgi:hypothetical protein
MEGAFHGNHVHPEQRVTVPRGSIRQAEPRLGKLAPLRANVVATERTKEATVTMHVVPPGPRSTACRSSRI